MQIATMAPKLLKLAPFFLSLASAVFLTIVLVAGAKTNVLQNYHFIKVDTSALSLPSKLSSSQILTDLSKISSQDYIGSPTTPSTLGISTVYTVHVFTCCGLSTPDYAGMCTTPLVGSSFDPFSNLRLASTALDRTYSPRMDSALQTYNHLSPFLGAGFILAFVLGLAAPTTMLLSKKIPRAAWVGVGLGAASTALLLAASVSAAIVMKELAGAMDAEFGLIGIRTTVGKLTTPAWASLGFSVLSTISLIFVARTVPQRRASLAAAEKGKGPAAQPFLSSRRESQSSLPPLDPPPRLPMATRAGYDPSDSSSRPASDMSGASGVTVTNRLSLVDGVISESSLTNTKRKSVAGELNTSYARYRPLDLEPVRG